MKHQRLLSAPANQDIYASNLLTGLLPLQNYLRADYQWEGFKKKEALSLKQFNISEPPNANTMLRQVESPKNTYLTSPNLQTFCPSEATVRTPNENTDHYTFFGIRSDCSQPGQDDTDYS